MTRGGSRPSGEVGDTPKWESSSPGNATTRGFDTVISGRSPAEELPHTIIDVSFKSPSPWCVITPTGENDRVVDEHDSIMSGYVSDMGEECDLRTTIMPDVSLSEVVVVQHNPFQEGRRNGPEPCVRERPV